MADLYAAIFLMLSLSLLLGGLSYALSRALSPSTNLLLLAGVLALLLIYLRDFRDSLMPAWIFPVSASSCWPIPCRCWWPA